jgi:PAS domain S-box-containing protein
MREAENNRKEDLLERVGRAEGALIESQRMIQSILDNAPLLVYVKDLEGRLTLVNREFERLFGAPRGQLLGKTSHALLAKEDADAHRANDLEVMARRDTVVAEERNLEPDGTRTYLSTKFPLFDAAGEMTGVCGISTDITERRRAEENYQTLFREMLDGFALHEIICDDDGHPVDYRFLAINPAFERMTGLKGDTVLGRTVLEVIPNIEPHWIETYGRVALTGEPHSFENYAAELKRHFEVTAFRPAPRQFACIFADITERKRAEEDRAKLESQLQQAHKMESVGRLAGGVAHDFNNMLGVILGHVELAMDQVEPSQPIHTDLQEIQKAACRSADLTRQLLAFARKQTVAPQVLDLNQTLEGMLKMLRRLVGENIDLVWKPGSGLWAINMDPSQIDQILANLCVNARDAIGDVGKITIESGNITFDQHFCARHAWCFPGDYVQLVVSDNGTGMDKDTLAHLFEPFFTTKEVGKGTGLGLATIYGIVKQNSGFIDVYSEPGHGTTFRIYLPRHGGQARATDPVAAIADARGHEIILLVEDEPAILNMTKRMLEWLGYTVVPASTPGEAIRLAKEHPTDIHLLLTDVVMPEMNGRDLAKAMLSFAPRMKRLFMSGYTADVIAHHGVLDKAVHFIQKPFSRRDLAAKVRQALEE